MSKSLDELSTEELGRLFPIVLTDKKYNWSELFEKEKSMLKSILSPCLAKRIIHFGSTSIPGIVTKATVDILVEIPEDQKLRNEVIEIMKSAGYQHMENHPTHIMFVKGYTPQGVEEISYHIHMGDKSETQLWDRIYFRDYLILNPNIAKEYDSLKRRLAKKYKFDREAYTKAKEEFVKEITSKSKLYYSKT